MRGARLGADVRAGAHLRVVGAYLNGDARWGVKELIEAIDRAAREVRKRFPDAILGVGHISRKDGGDLDHHHSHESGRDADLVEAFGIDSLQGLQILASVEKQCGVRLPDDELVEMRTIGRIADAVERLERGGSS